MPPKQRPVLPPLNTSITLPKESDRIKYWTKWSSLDKKGQEKLQQSDPKTYRSYVWGGIPDELRVKVWSIAITNQNTKIHDKMSDSAKPKFVQQLESISLYHNIFSSPNPSSTLPSKHINQNQINTISMALRFGATALDLDTYIDGSFDVLAAAIPFIPQLTPLYQLFIVLHNANNIFWAGTLKETRALQTFVITAMGIFHRDKGDLLERLDYAGLDLSDLLLLAKQWLYSFGAQIFPYAFTQRIIDIMLLDDIGPAGLSATFIGCLLHWHELGIQPIQHKNMKAKLFTINDLHTFPQDPRLNIDKIFLFSYQYFVDRFPSVELAFLDVNWPALLQLPQGSGFNLYPHPRFAYMIPPQGSPKPQQQHMGYNDSTLTSLEKLHFLTVCNPCFASDLFPQYKQLFTSLTSLPGYTPIGGYNTLPVRLLEVGKVLFAVNNRWSKKRSLLYRKQRKACPNQILADTTAVQSVSSHQRNNDFGHGNGGNGSGGGNLGLPTQDPAKALQKKLSVLHKNLSIFSTNLKKIIENANQTIPQTQQGQIGTWLRTAENDSKSLTMYVDPVIKLLNERVTLHLYDLPPTHIHPQDLPQVSKNSSPQQNSSSPSIIHTPGTIAYSTLPQHLPRPYLSMEGYLFRAYLFNEPIPGTKTIQQQISTIGTHFFKLLGPFLMEFESTESLLPINNRCIDLRGRAIVADKTPSGDYGYGITIYHSKEITSDKRGILFQLYSTQRGEFERWLACISAAIALPGSSTSGITNMMTGKDNNETIAQLSPNQGNQTNQNQGGGYHGPTGTIRLPAGSGPLLTNPSTPSSNSSVGPTGTMIKPPPTPKGLTNHSKK